MGVIARKPPKLGPIWPRTQKNEGYPKGKVENRKHPVKQLKLENPETMGEWS